MPKLNQLAGWALIAMVVTGLVALMLNADTVFAILAIDDTLHQR
jgi:hypothetical protein